MNDMDGPEPEATVAKAMLAESYELLENNEGLSGTVGRRDQSIASLSSHCSQDVNSLGVGTGTGK